MARATRRTTASTYAESQVIVTAGGKQALANAALALFGAGDEVITHAPGWPTIPEQIKLADATPVIVRTHAEDGFTLPAELHRRDHAANARHHHQLAGDPTGALMTEEELAAGECGRQGHLCHLDLCYEKLIYDPVPHNLPGVLGASCGTVPSCAARRRRRTR